MCPLNAACAVPVQAASRLAPFRLEAGQGFSILSLGLTSFFDFGDKKRPPTFRIVRPVNGLIFSIRFCVQFNKLEVVSLSSFLSLTN